MLGSLARHSFGAILLAVIIEELGGPEQLARAEVLLSRSGWGGIAVGRARAALRHGHRLLVAQGTIPALCDGPPRRLVGVHRGFSCDWSDLRAHSYRPHPSSRAVASGGVSAAYYEFVLPYLAPGGLSRLWQALGLALFTLGVFGVVLASSALIRRDDLLDPWWQTGGPVMVCGVAFGVAIYALTAVYGRVLAIAALPALRSRGA